MNEESFGVKCRIKIVKLYNKLKTRNLKYTEEINKRNISLDYIRTFAILCVVVNHVVEEIYPLNVEFINNVALKIKIFCIGGFTFGRIGVPLFFMLTGYLLLSREWDKDRIVNFYKHNVFSLILVWEVWILIYSIFESWINLTSFDLDEYLRRALFLEHAGLPHTWYMPVIIGIYLFLPFVASVLQNINKKILIILLLIMYFYLFVVPGMNLWQSALLVDSSSRVSRQIDLSFGGGVYGFYVILGYCFFVWEGKIQHVFKFIKFYFVTIVVSIFLFIVIILCQLRLYTLNYDYSLWYDFYLLPLLGICVFALFIREKQNTKMRCIFTEISKCAFGIYLVHELILILCIENIKINDKSLTIIILSIIVYLISFFMVEILSLIPKIRYLFLKK